MTYALHCPCPIAVGKLEEEEEEGFYKFLPANTADRLGQSWQSCPISDEYVYVYVYVYEGGSTPQKVAASQQCM